MDYSSADYESPEFYSIHDVKHARKEHKCFECGTIIKVGDSYEYASGLWDNGFKVFHTCWVCAQIRKDHFGLYFYGMLRQDFYACKGFDYMGEWVDYDKDDIFPFEHISGTQTS